MGRPVLDGLELEQVQIVTGQEVQAVERHAIPALEGDFLQELGRRAVRIRLGGVVTGATAAAGLKKLREKFRRAVPLAFTTDIATATQLTQVLIEAMEVREIAGRPERFEYVLDLREFIAATTPPTIVPPVPPPPKLTASLAVSVVVTGQPAFDLRTVTVTLTGTPVSGPPFATQTLTLGSDNRWTRDPIAPGTYTAQATAPDPNDTSVPPRQMTGSASATVADGQHVAVTIVLEPGKNVVVAKAFIVHFWFDRAFIEPSLRGVLAAAADHARNNSAEHLVIVGHTDKAGSETYNQSLSERRARSVFAYLNPDRGAAVAEWELLRRRGALPLPFIGDSWALREQQHMLQDLGFYRGNVDEVNGPQTIAAVRTFQTSHGFAASGTVDDATWSALIADYLASDVQTVDPSKLLANADPASGCDGGKLKWLGCGEEDPVVNVPFAFRPNRRTELLFVNATALPCRVPPPDTFNLPAPGAVSPTWCLGQKTDVSHCCFTARNGRGGTAWPVQSADPGPTFALRGTVTPAGGAQLDGVKYFVLAPDGEFMDGEFPSAPNSGRPQLARLSAGADGSAAFTYADKNKPKGPGFFSFTIIGKFVLRSASALRGTEKGNTVAVHLDGSQPFDLIATPA